MAKVVHFEVPVDDLDRAKAFYGTVFGWDISTFPMAGGDDYTGATTTPVDESQMPIEPGSINGALVARATDRPSTVITLGVEAIDAALAQVEAAGGSTLIPRAEIPGMGAYAYFTDSEGNVVGLWESAG